MGEKSQSVRTSPRRLKGTLSSGPRNSDFLTLVEQHTDAFVRSDDSAVEDVRKILADVRQQYDRVNSEAEKKAAELAQLREAIRVADASGSAKQDEVHALEERKVTLEKQYDDAVAQIDDAQTNRKVYQHMLERTLHEQAVLKEKMLMMEKHLGKKTSEVDRKINHNRKSHAAKVQSATNLELAEMDAENERAMREGAMNCMNGTLQTKRNAIKRRADFERWRHEVALEAANEAFQASAGRLRKLYAIEKLAGNCLQKITFEQVERSQATEDGFQKIREVTGLTDVMDIVHKFLNRDVEHEQLKNAVKEAETKLEALQDHEMSRTRLQKSTLQVEHMKRWANRMSRSLAAFEDPVAIDKPADLLPYFQQLQHTVEKFIAHIQSQLSSGKVQRKTMSQAASKEYHEQARLLNDKEFIRSNCRVPVSADGRPASGGPGGRQGQSGNEEDPAVALANEREKHKSDSINKVNEVARKNDMAKKKVAAKQ